VAVAWHSKVHLEWRGFLQGPHLPGVHLGFAKCTPHVCSMYVACRCTHGHTGAPLEFRGALVNNKGAHGRRWTHGLRPEAHLQGSIYIFSHSFIWLNKKKKACAVMHIYAAAAATERSKSAHIRSNSLLLTGYTRY
jgi:hypothetical protein